MFGWVKSVVIEAVEKLPVLWVYTTMYTIIEYQCDYDSATEIWEKVFRNVVILRERKGLRLKTCVIPMDWLDS